jgi:hypothetical protein
MPFDDDEQEEHEQVAIEKKHIEDSIEEMLIHISKTEVANYLGGIAAKLGADDMQRVSVKESSPDRMRTVGAARMSKMGEYGKIDAEDGNPPSKIGRGNPEYMEAYNAVLIARGEEPLDVQQPDQAYLDALRSGQLEESKDLGDRIAEALSKKLKEYGWDDDEDEFGGEDLSQYEKEFPDAFNAGGDRDEDAEAAAAKDAEIDDLMSKYGMSDGDPEEEDDVNEQAAGGDLVAKVAELMETDPEYQYTLKPFAQKLLAMSQSPSSRGPAKDLEAICPDWVPGQDIFGVVKKAQEQMGATTMREESVVYQPVLSDEEWETGDLATYEVFASEEDAQARFPNHQIQKLSSTDIEDAYWADSGEPVESGGGAIDRGHMEEPEDDFGSPAHYQEDTGYAHSQLRHSRLNETLMKWAIK